MRRFTISASVGLVAVALATAGCGGNNSSGGTHQGSAQVAPQGAAQATPDLSGAAAAAGGGSATCNQLTRSDVQPLLVDPIATVTVTAAGTGGEGQQCVFGTASDGAVDILVLRGDDGTSAYAQGVHAMTKPISISGIGDKAARDTGDDQPEAIKGDEYCGVSLSSDESVPGVGQLEAAAGGTTHIGERAEGIVATALGTLCNRIYGSGNTTPDLSGLTASSASPAG